MAVQATCPHCATPCLIGEQFLASPVRCFACGRVFRLSDNGSAATATSKGQAETALMPTFDAETERPPKTPGFDIGFATSAGKVRERNEDCYLIRRQAWSRLAQAQELALLAVFDGMGGHGGGDKASRLAAQSLQTAMSPLFDGAGAGAISLDAKDLVADRIRAALNDASKAVHGAAQADPQLKGMGAAAVVAVAWRDQLRVGHVGDCRAYHFRAGTLKPLTKDQTLVQRMLDLGTLSPQEALNHPAKNELSQALGRRPDVEPGACQLALSPGDWLILASDGLHVHLGYDDLRKEIELALPSAPFLAEHLIEVVNRRGGSDNCTVVTLLCS